MARTRGWWPIAAIVLVLVGTNLATNRVLPSSWYVPFAVALAASLVVFARLVDGRTPDELGLARGSLAAGLRWGGACSLALAGVLLVGFALAPTRDLFLDDRVRHASAGWVAFAALVRVPLGTVVLEEVAFRSVLPGMLAARVARWWAYTASSVLFGLWHVLPALGLETVNPVATDTVGDAPGALVVGAAVAATTLVGLAFCWLRERSGSLLAPVLVHWTANAGGYVLAYAAWNR